MIFTGANADPDGRVINRMIEDYVKKNADRCAAFASLGQLRYLSALQFCDLVMGNSSSGIIEAPSFGIPTIDIGDRQRGRVSADSVIHCGYETADIEGALERALSEAFRAGIRERTNPYEGENTSGKILDVIGKALDEGIDLKKKFYDISG